MGAPGRTIYNTRQQLSLQTKQQQQPRPTQKAPAQLSTNQAAATVAASRKRKTQSTNLTDYQAPNDGTLTPNQQSQGGFRPAVVQKIISHQHPGDFRSPSNMTLAGHKSGYHEAFIPTDFVLMLADRTNAGNGRSQMPAPKPRGWQGGGGATFPEKNISSMLEAADGTRTDTARTILSSPGGQVAGHTGSGVSLDNQKPAHDMLRTHGLRVLQDPRMDSATLAVIAGATAATSLAPGVYASQARNAGNLKDAGAKDDWEERRTEMKARTNHLHGKLNVNQQNLVRDHMGQFMKDLQDVSRHLDPVAPVSPLRTAAKLGNNLVSGGGYHPGGAIPMPELSLDGNANVHEQTMFVTEPGRGAR